MCLDWLGPTPGIAGDNKEIWQTETEGEDQTWTKDGAMAYGLKIQNALVYGHVSGYTAWISLVTTPAIPGAWSIWTTSTIPRTATSMTP